MRRGICAISFASGVLASLMSDRARTSIFHDFSFGGSGSGGKAADRDGIGKVVGKGDSGGNERDDA